MYEWETNQTVKVEIYDNAGFDTIHSSSPHNGGSRMESSSSNPTMSSVIQSELKNAISLSINENVSLNNTDILASLLDNDAMS